LKGHFFEGVTKMKVRLIVGLLALSLVVPTVVPVRAAQAHPVKLSRRWARHREAPCRQTVFGMGVEGRRAVQDQSRPGVLKDDWPNNMILDSFRSHEVSNAEKMTAAYVI
jgi:hypothetical protein